MLLLVIQMHQRLCSIVIVGGPLLLLLSGCVLLLNKLLGLLLILLLELVGSKHVLQHLLLMLVGCHRGTLVGKKLLLLLLLRSLTCRGIICRRIQLSAKSGSSHGS